MRSIALVLMTSFAVTALLSGCGKKGPLYLPEEQEIEQQNQQTENDIQRFSLKP